MRVAVLGILALIAFGAGTVGYLRMGDGVSDAVYGSLQLFFFDSPSSDEMAPRAVHFLEPARFLAGAVSLSALLLAGIAVFRDAIDLRLARRASGHYIVAGLGGRGRHLARSLLAEGEKVVVIDRMADNPHVGEIRHRGGRVIFGDAGDRVMLERAGLPDAEALVAVTRDDSVNSRVAAGARKLLAGQPQAPGIFAHIGARTSDTAITALTVSEDGSGADVEWFNLDRIAARRLLSRYAGMPFTPGRGNPSDLLVVGGNDLALSLILEAARRTHFLRGHAENGGVGREGAGGSPAPGGGDPRARQRIIHVETHESPHRPFEESLYAGLDDVVAVERHSRADAVSCAERAAGVGTVFISLDDPIEALAIAGLIVRTHQHHELPEHVVICSDQDIEDLDGLIADEIVASGIEFVDTLDLAADSSVFEYSLFEELARQNHYVFEREIAGVRPPRPWRELESELKAVHRMAAAHHVERKLPHVGLRLRPITDFREPAYVFSDGEVEELARLEHERWWEERVAAGWRMPQDGGSVIDAGRKLDPDLAAWEDLGEESRERKRALVRQLPHMLVATGFTIERE